MSPRSVLCVLSLSLLASPALAQLKVKEKPKEEQPKDTTPMTPIKPAEAPAPKPAAPGAATLKVGDPAPPIAADAWVKGQAVSTFEKGRVYVVEFWATWCGPCRESIPHLTQLQKKYKNDLTIIGMASSERRPKEGEADKRLDTVKEFVTKQGAKMDYHVAFDANRAMSKAWMEPAAQQYIPTAFVVGADGKIAWFKTIGGDDERKELDRVLEEELKKAKNAPPAKPDAKPAKEPKKKDDPTKSK